MPSTHTAAAGGNRPCETNPSYLSEAQQIAERGPMPLFLADVHLHRARLVLVRLARRLGDPRHEQALQHEQSRPQPAGVRAREPRVGGRSFKLIR